MRQAALLALLLAACGPRDPLAAVKQDYPGAGQYLGWRSYALVRYPEESEEPAVLLRKQDGEWRELARSKDGFVRGWEVMNWIPELDEDGVKALDLH
ncbi:MAG: hypothetical protein R6X12_03945 [bacterium]